MINFTQSFDTNILIASHDEVGEIFASVLAERSNWLQYDSLVLGRDEQDSGDGWTILCCVDDWLLP